jgi:hypothetical protein
MVSILSQDLILFIIHISSTHTESISQLIFLFFNIVLNSSADLKENSLNIFSICFKLSGLSFILFEFCLTNKYNSSGL